MAWLPDSNGVPGAGECLTLDEPFAPVLPAGARISMAYDVSDDEHRCRKHGDAYRANTGRRSPTLRFLKPAIASCDENTHFSRLNRDPDFRSSPRNARRFRSECRCNL